MKKHVTLLSKWILKKTCNPSLKMDEKTCNPSLKMDEKTCNPSLKMDEKNM